MTGVEYSGDKRSEFYILESHNMSDFVCVVHVKVYDVYKHGSVSIIISKV